jgi:hypothetical protein
MYLKRDINRKDLYFLLRAKACRKYKKSEFRLTNIDIYMKGVTECIKQLKSNVDILTFAEMFADNFEYVETKRKQNLWKMKSISNSKLLTVSQIYDMWLSNLESNETQKAN